MRARCWGSSAGIGPLNGSLGFALANVAAWTAIAVFLDRKRFYLKV